MSEPSTLITSVIKKCDELIFFIEKITGEHLEYDVRFEDNQKGKIFCSSQII